MTVYECIFDLWQNTNKPSENWLTEIDFWNPTYPSSSRHVTFTPLKEKSNKLSRKFSRVGCFSGCWPLFSLQWGVRDLYGSLVHRLYNVKQKTSKSYEYKNGGKWQEMNRFVLGGNDTAEVIFLLDCSTSVTPMCFHYLTQFIKSVVESFSIGPSNIRVGVVPFSDDVYQAFGINKYSMAYQICAAIGKYWAIPLHSCHKLSSVAVLAQIHLLYI